MERWAEDSGNAALAGHELPPDEVLAADQRITAWALELKKSGLEGDMDVLRARAFLDLLLSMDSRPRQDGAAAPARAPRRSGAGRVRRTSHPDRPADQPDRADRPAGRALRDRPVDPWLARDLAAAAARNPTTTWCVTVTDEQGHAVATAAPGPTQTPQETSRTGDPGRAGVLLRGPAPDRRRVRPWRLRTPGAGPDLLVSSTRSIRGRAITGSRPRATIPGSSFGT